MSLPETTDVHVPEVTRLMTVLARLQQADDPKRVLRGLREAARDLVALHRVLVEEISVAQALLGEEESEDARMSSPLRSTRHGLEGDHHALIHAELRALLRWESTLYQVQEAPPVRRGSMQLSGPASGMLSMPDSESFGWAAVTQIVEAVKVAVADRGPSDKDRLLQELTAARTARAPKAVITRLEREISKAYLEETP